MNRPSVTLPSPNPATNTSYNEANQMLTFNDKNIVYDSNGNMTSVTNSCGTTNYTWNARNQLVGITGFKLDCTSLSASFKYDVLGRRIEKTINGTTTQYVYDGVDIIQEKQGGAVKANYIREFNIDEPLLRSTQNALRLYKMDALGSVIALTDDTGVVKTTYSYDPFGNTTISGEASDNPFQYTGRENDGTGLYYYRARYYSPELQRFISEDPLECERKQGNNLYIYVKNNPIRFIDPYGLSECENNCSDFLKRCYLLAAIAGGATGFVCNSLCVIITKAPVFCKVICAGTGASIAGTLQLYCYKTYQKCANDCKDKVCTNGDKN